MVFAGTFCFLHGHLQRVFLAIINVLAMCDFNLLFSLGFSHADVCVGATDV